MKKFLLSPLVALTLSILTLAAPAHAFWSNTPDFEKKDPSAGLRPQRRRGQRGVAKRGQASGEIVSSDIRATHDVPLLHSCP